MTNSGTQLDLFIIYHLSFVICHFQKTADLAAALHSGLRFAGGAAVLDPPEVFGFIL